MKSKLTLLATLAALGTGGGIAYFARSSTALADTGITLADSATFMIQWNLARRGDGTINCAGVCRTSTASNTYVMRCPVSVAPTATTGACLTALAAACAPTACSADQ